MSTLTKAGRQLQRDALAAALVGGAYVIYDGDGRELGKATFPKEWEREGDSAFVFRSLDQGRVSRAGIASSFAAIPDGGDSALIAGTIGQALGKGVDVVVEPINGQDGRQLYEGMDLDIELFRHEAQFDI